MLIVGEAVLLGAVAVVAVLTSSADDWRPPGLVVILLALALVTDRFAVSHHGQRISGSFLALVLAMALLGPAPGGRDRRRPRCSSITCARATRCRG